MRSATGQRRARNRHIDILFTVAGADAHLTVEAEGAAARGR
jgi:hypothetical protein